MDQQSISLNDAADIFRRRWPVTAIVALVVFLGVVVTAFTLENVYRSIGEVGVTEPERGGGIDPRPVKPLDLRIYELTDEVMSRRNVIEAIEKFNLFPDDRIDDSPASVVGLVRMNFEVDLKRQETDPTSRELGKVIGFTATFYYKDPRTARDVAKFFLDKFVEAKDRRRNSAGTDTVRQYEIEVAGYKQELGATEQRLARFKEQYPNAMPDQKNWNMQQIERKSGELVRVESDIRSLRARIDDIYNQIAETSPYDDELKNQLEALQKEFVRLIGTYTADHPEVRRVRRQLETLMGAGSNFVLRQMLQGELRREREKLLTMPEGPGLEDRERRATERRVQVLEQELAELPTDSTQAEEPTNPEYRRLQILLRAAQSEQRAQQQRGNNLRTQITDLEESLIILPEIELQLQEILRDIELYSEQLKTANKNLEVARTLIDRDPWETWTTTPPRPVYEPAFPNRPLYIILGAFIGLTLGIGAGLIAEAFDSTIRGARDVRSVMQMPPIAAIPVIKTASDRRRDRLRLATVAGMVLVAVGAVGAYVHFQINGII